MMAEKKDEFDFTEVEVPAVVIAFQSSLAGHFTEAPEFFETWSTLIENTNPSVVNVKRTDCDPRTPGSVHTSLLIR